MPTIRITLIPICSILLGEIIRYKPIAMETASTIQPPLSLFLESLTALILDMERSLFAS